MRLLVAAFLAIATAISVNALYFQAPRLAARGISTTAQKSAPAPPASTAERARALVTAALPAKRTPEPLKQTKTAEPAPTQSLVRAIQKKLAQFGFKALPQDGLPGPETRAAILAAEFEQGLPLTGEPRDGILTGLFFLEASGRNRLASSDRFERDARLVKEVQDLLAKLGYTSGPVNGQLDEATREAIRKFEADRRLNADGRLTERILLEMIIEKGQPLLAKG
jgi:peptidoglycan hydrolase-like protein with peptidoglycan-binding domain